MSEEKRDFEVGKCYRHNHDSRHEGGGDIKVLCKVNTTRSGYCFILERPKLGLSVDAIVVGSQAMENNYWKEISESEWLANFKRLEL